MAQDRVLIIEDDTNIAELVAYNLQKEGYLVRVQHDGEKGLEEARRSGTDLLILDLMLPGMNGLEICRILKQNAKTASIPIIILTAKGEESDQVIGLELGADDYVVKPFSPKQLAARVRAVLRRSRQQPMSGLMKAGLIEIDTERHIVLLKGKTVRLTSKEFELLKSLMEVHGRVLSREYLLEHVWGYDSSLNLQTRTVDMHIGMLRKKLKPEASRIVTVKNTGYRLDET